MNKYFKFIIFSLICFLNVHCISSPERIENRLNIIVSILPQVEFVEAVAGDYAKVSVMIPSGASPAVYEPTPKQLKLISTSDIYFKVGELPFERTHVKKFRKLNHKLILINTSSEVKYIESDHSHGDEDAYDNDDHFVDPHIWMDPILVIKQVIQIRDALIQFDPKHKKIYQKNAKIYISKLEKINKEINILFRSKKEREILVYHPFLAYFGQRYGITQYAIEVDGKQPSLKQLNEMIKEFKQKKINSIFVQRQFSSRLPEVFAKELKIKVVSVDPLDQNYAENILGIAKKISENL